MIGMSSAGIVVMLGAIPLLLVVSAPIVEGPRSSMCSMYLAPFRHPVRTAFLVDPFDLTVPVQTDSTPSPGREPTRYPGPVDGSYARIRSIRGAAPEALSRFLARGDSSVILVAWGTEADCTYVAGRGPSARMGRQHIVAIPRPEREWIKGRPVLDIPIGYWATYPGLRMAQWRTKPDHLTPLEFADFYQALPTGEAFMADCATAMKPLQEWKRTHAPLARKFPVGDVAGFPTCGPQSG